jgi:hypothetical protein
VCSSDLADDPAPASTKDKIAENTHTRGKTAAKFVDDWKPVWGNEQLGIQYGIALTTPRRQFRKGERVPMAAFIRNASDKPLQIRMRPDFFWNMPKVVNETGKAIEFEKRVLLGTIPHYGATLQPGEAFGPIYLNFGLGNNPRPGNQNWHPYCKPELFTSAVHGGHCSGKRCGVSGQVPTARTPPPFPQSRSMKVKETLKDQSRRTSDRCA